VLLEHLSGNSRIGAAGDGNRTQVLLETKLPLEADLEGVLPRPAAGDEGSVDVEKKQGGTIHLG
jgi:hypothetical protein